MRSTDNLNLVPKHIMTLLSESPCLIISKFNQTKTNRFLKILKKGICNTQMTKLKLILSTVPNQLCQYM